MCRAAYHIWRRVSAPAHTPFPATLSSCCSSPCVGRFSTCTRPLRAMVPRLSCHAQVLVARHHSLHHHHHMSHDSLAQDQTPLHSCRHEQTGLQQVNGSGYSLALMLSCIVCVQPGQFALLTLQRTTCQPNHTHPPNEIRIETLLYCRHCQQRRRTTASRPTRASHRPSIMHVKIYIYFFKLKPSMSISRPLQANGTLKFEVTTG